MQMASRGGKHYKAQGKNSRWDFQHFACLYGDRDHSESEEEWFWQRRLVHAGKRDEHLAIMVLLEKNRTVIKDACWLWPMNDVAHINLAGQDAVLMGINLALLWGGQNIAYADSLCMYNWVLDTLTGKARVRIKAASEMLIRRLSIIKKLTDEYELSMDVTFPTGWPGYPKDSSTP